MNRRIFSFVYVGIYVWLAMLSGCSNHQVYNKKYYMLSATREKGTINEKNDSILDIRHFTIDSAYSGKGFVYRIGKFEYESDFYNEFLVSPSALITEKVRNWISESSLFKRVLDHGSQADPTHLIEGNITELYGDFRDKESPIAVVEIRIFLLEIKDEVEPVIVIGKTYKSSIIFDSKSVEDLVRAFDKCLTEILINLESDLSEILR